MAAGDRGAVARDEQGFEALAVAGREVGGREAHLLRDGGAVEADDDFVGAVDARECVDVVVEVEIYLRAAATAR